jgi:hypothetical protein
MGTMAFIAMFSGLLWKSPRVSAFHGYGLMLFTKSWRGQYLLFKKSGDEADLPQDNGLWFAFGYPRRRLREWTLGESSAT